MPPPGRQQRATRVPETTYYVYDAAGQRVRKVTERAAPDGSAHSRKSERIYLGTFEIYREYGADGTATLERDTLHVLDDKHRVALVETRTAGTDRGPGQLIRYQLANHLDSSVLELDQRAQVISYEEYYPYGSTSYQAVRARTETPKRYRYTGKERDTETGLYYHGARYYAPWLGRWTSCDPAGLVDGPNLYAYVGDNPVAYGDPSGKEARVILDPQHHTATVQTTVHIYGVDASQRTAVQAVTQQAQALWTNPTVATQQDVEKAQAAKKAIPDRGMSVTINNQTWTLKFDIKYQIHVGSQAPIKLSAPTAQGQTSVYDIDRQRAVADKFEVGDNAITLQRSAGETSAVPSLAQASERSRPTWSAKCAGDGEVKTSAQRSPAAWRTRPVMPLASTNGTTRSPLRSRWADTPDSTMTSWVATRAIRLASSTRRTYRITSTLRWAC